MTCMLNNTLCGTYACKRKFIKTSFGTNMKRRFNLREFCKNNCVVLWFYVSSGILGESLACEFA